HRLDCHEIAGRYPGVPETGRRFSPLTELLRQRLLLGRLEPFSDVDHVGERTSRACRDRGTWRPLRLQLLGPIEPERQLSHTLRSPRGEPGGHATETTALHATPSGR